ncbi:MAG TPA: DUF4783 domain-containing protein [Bacteroidia bacterium]|nr:DUF4783 domain-containing protein [Bacteroidia bacterium]MBX3105726.1 DUF4783 domain-containing protein [Bacteroidota bacterium]MCE7954736.1 DUF4783 domain-containing protein [Bacteroidetes bacterium CHB6]OQB61891.1 MAG: hypothetical protein BWX95_01688 [Bacteroidetes bacterium ADurb.Bin141]MBV6453402.1 hypothetical protein [Bacteroidia bacterium]
MKRTLQLLLSLMMVFAVAKAADVFDDIGSAIRTGDARQIARYFNNNVDLTVFNQEEVYSKAQAEMVLKDFFSKNSPKSFTIIHRGVSKEGARYAIGTLTTTQGQNIRTYFFFKESGGMAYIQELRFEKE